MKMGTLACILALIPQAAFAAPTQIFYDAKISIDGKPVSNPRVLAVDGEKAMIEVVSKTHGTVKLEITPEIMDDGNIRTGYSLKVQKDGTTHESRFRMVSRNGELAGLAESSNAHDFRFEVRATKQSSF